MTHSITPPPELSDEQVGEWLIDDGYPWDPSEQAVITITTNRLKHVACQAFQAGADQELEACCEWLENQPQWMEDLRSARRKAPSLKKQALDLLDKAEDPSWDINDFSVVRRALEQLDY